ncbi:MAG: hypothetical protein NZ839_00535 [Endomicrobia bacterium]|nr:hypothetical protein [Endomicrobiia bacterium]
MKKFIDSTLYFFNKLTYKNFEKYYRAITSLEGSEFFPHPNVSKVYYNFIKSLKPNLGEGDILALITAPRMCQKTTTFSIVLPVLLINWSYEDENDLSCIVIGSYKLEKTKETIFRRIKKILSAMEFEIIQSDKKFFLIKKDEKEIRISIIHPQEDLRSYSFGYYRPQLIILDDLDTPSALSGSSEEGRINERLRIVRNFQETWIPAREQKNSIIYAVGNFENQVSILKLLDNINYVHKLKLSYKREDGSYLLPDWNEEWEKKTREVMGDEAFERQYAHILASDKYNLKTSNVGLGRRISLIDLGKTNDSLVSVNIIGNMIVSIIYGSYAKYKYFLEEINEFDPEEIYFDATSTQEYFSIILTSYFPRARIFSMDTSKLQLNKQIRMLIALMQLENGNIVLSQENEMLLSLIREEIEKMKTNSHVFDIIGTWWSMYKEENTSQLIQSTILESKNYWNDNNTFIRW